MAITRRQFLGTSAGIAASAAWGAAPAAEAKRPNLVYILCDDLGYGDLACYGHPVIQTPHLDRLATQGLRLTDCYAGAPVCSPARAAVVTGRNPYRCGIGDWIPEDTPVHLRADEVSIATLLREAGYATGFSGKWHLSSKMDGSQPLPGDHGFQHWFATQNNAKPNHHNPVNFYRNGEEAGPIEGYSSDIIAEEAIRFMEQQQDDPFALFVWFHSPHEPIATAPRFTDPYTPDAPELQADYFGNVTHTDDAVGQIVAALDRLGLADNTLVWFTSDNGPETLERYRGAARSYGSPGDLRGMKLHLYEGGIRVPGIIRWPGVVSAGAESDVPVSGVDVFPTFAHLGGAAVPTGLNLDGSDITGLLRADSFVRDRPLYWRYDRALGMPKHAMRHAHWKIVADAEFGTVEVYNVAEDIEETRNLVSSEPDRTRALLGLLREAAESVDADWQANRFS